MTNSHCTASENAERSLLRASLLDILSSLVLRHSSLFLRHQHRHGAVSLTEVGFAHALHVRRSDFFVFADGIEELVVIAEEDFIIAEHMSFAIDPLQLAIEGREQPVFGFAQLLFANGLL